jgi:hypothetical protein
MIFSAMCCLRLLAERSLGGIEQSMASAACEWKKNCLFGVQETRSPGRRSWESDRFLFGVSIDNRHVLFYSAVMPRYASNRSHLLII